MKKEITRTELSKIHKIACSQWKPKIEKYANANPFSEKINFTEKEIQEMISACTAEQLPIVKEIFEVKDTWEDIKTLEDACKQLGEKDSDVIELRKLQCISISEHILYNQIAVVITKALNGGWVSNWDDSNEYKYFPWFYLGKDFRCGDCNYWTSCSTVSARLCFKSSDLATYAGKQFTEVYKKFMN